MKVKCDYCRQMIDDGLDKCPNCGATINKNRTSAAQPKTIEELKKWYTDHNLPPEETTRFFIGKNYQEPKAFGIYQADDGDFVVYKNKANGERAIRYQGSDEEYAVNELYQRLKVEIADQKSHNQSKPSSSSGMSKPTGCCSSTVMKICGIGFAIFMVICMLVAIFDKTPSNGYYKYNGNDYYRQGSSWYSYDDDSDTWSQVDDDSFLNDSINSDTQSEYQSDDFDGSSFEDSTWYDSGTSDDSSDWDSDSFWDSDDTWDSDYDSGSSWDSGSDSSWDSGSDSGWDSDW
ncbi:MAG: hypothetical protein K6B14_06925 [Lachnospiraceae bacterium]|nr:hypothetical protein [Lachnospiraceae bacterium]